MPRLLDHISESAQDGQLIYKQHRKAQLDTLFTFSVGEVLKHTVVRYNPSEEDNETCGVKEIYDTSIDVASWYSV